MVYDYAIGEPRLLRRRRDTCAEGLLVEEKVIRGWWLILIVTLGIMYVETQS